MNERFWLRLLDLPWQEVIKEQYIAGERAAGFHPKSGNGVATRTFSTYAFKGRVTQGEINHETYGFDPEFVRAATKEK